MSVINTNIKSLVARDALTVNNRQLATAMERLSTGKRINSAADDAAGLGIATRMDSQVRGLSMAIKNANDAISVTQTAEGAMQEINSILQRMREIAVQSSSDSNSDTDRAYLQAEVSQLSDEINRIATTTQFNSINVLDGGFTGKSFQIGANAGQTIGMDIGDMRASALGVASSEVARASSTPSRTVTTEEVTVKAQGIEANQTRATLSFVQQASSQYDFTLTDDVSGLTGSVDGQGLDLTSDISKDAFIEALNKSLRQSATDTSITGISVGSASIDATLAASDDDLKFSIRIGDGSIKNIDIKQRLIDQNGVTGATAVGGSALASAIQAELREAYGDEDRGSITTTFAAATGFITVTDAEGRAIAISQGIGSGHLFGTDAANVSASNLMSVGATVQNNIYAEWGDSASITLTNTAGGEIKMNGFSATAGAAYNRVTFDADPDDEYDLDPIVFTEGDYGTIDATGNLEARYQGRVEATEMALTFSQTYGASAGAATSYTFNLTNGDGDVYAAVSALDINPENMTNAQVESAVIRAISVGVLALSGDNQIDASEFDVSFDGTTLLITNQNGRHLAVENFSSATGSMSVQALNELGRVETLASQNHLFSEVRIGVNTAVFGISVAHTAAGDFTFKVNGFSAFDSASGASAIAVDFSDGSITSGDELASAIHGQISALAENALVYVDGARTTAYLNVEDIDVYYDDATAEIVIRDGLGRQLGFGYHTGNPFHGTDTVFRQDFVTGAANNDNAVKVESSIAKGDVIEATRVTATLNQNDSTFTFKLNGQTLTSTQYIASEPFATSDLKDNLDALMKTLNGLYPEEVYEYEVDGLEITFWNRAGGPLEFSDFVSTGTVELDDALTMTLVGAEGQGATRVAQQIDDTTDATAIAKGSLASATEAVMTLSQDDIYSMVINNGENDYTLSPTVIDLSETASATAFSNALSNALRGSGIEASMDTSGRVYLSRADGGTIGVKSFSSVNGGTASWAPASGQGDADSLDGSGSVTTTSRTTSSSSSSSSGSIVAGGSTAVDQITVSTQEESLDALAVIDLALDYVNAERAKLGAVENRLTHTIDNLTNVVTNTEAARSRILDTDYAAETTELARAQIVQQAATAMLAQANQAPMSVLSLLQ